MNVGEQALLAILVAFVAGVTLALLWSRYRSGRGEARGHETKSLHYILGLDLLASRQIDRAVTELTQAARDNTEAIEIYLILGNLLREKGQLERAIQIHQSVLHRPRLSRSERAHALLCLGMDFKRAGFRNRALDTLREVVALDPENAYALSSLVKLYEEENDWEKALATEEKLSGVTGSRDTTLCAFLHDQIGQRAAAEGDTARAVRAFEEAIRTDPRVAPPHLHYGELLESQGEPEKAEARWLAFARDNPSQAYLVFERLERVREDLGRPDTMADLYESVIEQDDKDWRARLALAAYLRERGELDRAFRLMLEAVRNNPHALAAHLPLWRLLAEAGAEQNRLTTYVDEVARAAYFVDPHVCISCGYRANGLPWRCPHCQEWSTFVEERVETAEG